MINVLSNINQIKEYLSACITDPVPMYIFRKEICKDNASSYIDSYNNIKTSKWYLELAGEQLDNGSWGRFHTQDSKTAVKRKFVTTEAALRRARDLSLDKDDPIIDKCIKLMEKYVLEEETWTDNIETHHDGGKSHLISRTFLTAANISLFDPENPVVKPKRDICAENLAKAFTNGRFDEAVWDKENLEYRGTCLKAYMAYPLWLAQSADCISETLQRQYLDYILRRKEGIYYISNFPPSDKRRLEDKDFTIWLSTLENLSGFSLFPEFMERDALPHLYNEINRLILNEVTLPSAPPVIGHYSESWRDKNARKIDIILRIARIIAKCQA